MHSGKTMVRRTFLHLAPFLILAACVPAPAGRDFPSRPVADHGVSSRPVNGPPLFYPTNLLVQRKEGHAIVECVVAANGMPRDCHVVETVGGSEFATSALDYISRSTFAPAIRGGVSIEAQLRSTVTFALTPPSGGNTGFKNILAPRMVAGGPLFYPERMRLAQREASVEVTCRITVEGFAKDCVAVETMITGGSSDSQTFEDAALDFMKNARFAPELNHGIPVDVQHKSVINYRLTGSTLPPGIPDVPPSEPGQPIMTPASAQPIAGTSLAFPAKMVAGGRQGSVEVRCFVTVQGTTHNCLVVGSTGDRDFEAAALEIISHAVFTPTLLDGHALEGPREWTLRYGEP